jgi:hypothetical protein
MRPIRCSSRLLAPINRPDGHGLQSVAARKIRSPAKRRNRRTAMSFGYKKICAWCSEEFETSYRTKLCCSPTCARRLEVTKQRDRERLRRQKKREAPTWRAASASLTYAPQAGEGASMVLEGPRLWLANIHPET